MGTLEGDMEAALEALLAQHRTAADWAKDLAEELERAQARMTVLADAVTTTATLLPENTRAQVAECLAAQARAPLPGGTKVAAMHNFLRLQQGPFTPSELAHWLTRAGHGPTPPRAAARILHRATQQGHVSRVGRGRYLASN